MIRLLLEYYLLFDELIIGKWYSKNELVTASTNKVLNKKLTKTFYLNLLKQKRKTKHETTNPNKSDK